MHLLDKLFTLKLYKLRIATWSRLAARLLYAIQGLLIFKKYFCAIEKFPVLISQRERENKNKQSKNVKNFMQ